MSKELEALQTLKFIDNPMKDYVLWKQSIEIIEQALIEKEAYENKVNRLFEIIHKCGLNHFVDVTIHKDEYRKLEQELKGDNK